MTGTTDAPCRGILWRPLVLVAAALLVPALSASQPQVRFSGYVVDFPAYQKLNSTLATLFGTDQDQFFNLTRVRLRPTLLPWTDGELSVEYEITGLYKTSEFTTGADLSAPNRNQLVNLSWVLIDTEHYTARHFIDRLYFKQMFDVGEIVVGRQRISMGTGRIWNPTDLFNPINPASFSKIEKDGVDALTGRLYLGSFTDLSFVYNPYDDFRKKNIGAKFRSNVAEYDFSFLAGRFGDRDVLGADFAGNFFDAGLRGEGIYSAPHDDFSAGFVKAILGLDNQFTPELYALIEYHYNGEGTTDRFSYDLARLLAGEILNVGTQYLAAMASYLFHPLVTANATNITNLVDGSGLVNLTLQYSMSSNAALLAGAQLTYGDQFSEYWYFPPTTYIQIDYYF